MFKIKVKKKGLVEIKFTHYMPDGKNERTDFNGLHGTHCMISNHNGAPLATGESTLIPPDQYHRERGRKISLRYALKNLGISKKERAKVWKAYFAAQEYARWLALTQEIYKQ